MRIVKRVLIGILVLFALLVLLLIASVVVDYAVGGSRIDAVTNITIPGDNGEPDVRAYVARPQGSGPFPAAIMIHEFYGLNESIASKAEGLAEEGYIVVAPDTFRGSTTAWIPRAIFQVITTDPAQVNRDLDSVFAWMATQPDIRPESIGVLGFCYGGRAALSYSLHNNSIAATVVFYGAPETDPAVLAALPGPVLGIFGGADTSIPLDDVRAFESGLQQAGIPHEITIYEGQPHAFVTSMDAVRAGGVQAQAWNQMVAFLNASLSGGSSQRVPDQSDYRQPFAWRYYLMLAYEHAFGSAHH
ncbi:MAG TPA: dienelactone hydrolase family protein [Levilinea sp.]|nr:dienelactone hydrolase family protein [Levilinea sp.]